MAQRAADEVKASAHKEAYLIRHEARLSVEIASYGDRANEARREQLRALETAQRAKSELRSLLMTHLALLDKTDFAKTLPAAPIMVPASESGLARL